MAENFFDGPIVPMDNFDILSSSDDEQDPPNRRRPRQQETRPRLFRQHIDYYNMLSDEQFSMRFRLKKLTVTMLLNLIMEDIKPKYLSNHAIGCMDRLLLTLRFLATGSFFISAGDFIGVSKSAAHKIVYLVVQAIVKLRPVYIKMPVTDDERDEVRRAFYDKACFPKVIGAIDCTHIRVTNPGGEDAATYMNRKGYYSKNVQVISGPNLEIFDIVTRWAGSLHDQTIFDNSRVKDEFDVEQPHISIYGSDILIGDSGYECRKYLLPPLTNPQTPAEIKYNESLIRTRVTVERLFGTWKRRFPILSLGIRTSAKNAHMIDYYIMACAVLHNIAVKQNDPEPDRDPQVEIRDPSPHAVDQVHRPAHGSIAERYSVRDHLIATHFRNLINARGERRVQEARRN